jgi:hypothetical protein
MLEEKIEKAKELEGHPKPREGSPKREGQKQ